MSVYPLVYQQPAPRASARCFHSTAGWPYGPGRGPPISFTSPSDLGSCPGRLLDRPRKKASRLAMKLSRQCEDLTRSSTPAYLKAAPTCSSSTSVIPRGMQCHDCSDVQTDLSAHTKPHQHFFEGILRKLRLWRRLGEPSLWETSYAKTATLVYTLGGNLAINVGIFFRRLVVAAVFITAVRQ
jgi:hypothetical protein